MLTKFCFFLSGDDDDDDDDDDVSPSTGVQQQVVQDSAQVAQGPTLSVGDDNSPLVAEDYAGDVIEDAAADGVGNVDNNIDIVVGKEPEPQGIVQQQAAVVNQVQADEEDDDDDDDESDELDDVLDDGKYSRIKSFVNP